MKGKFAFDKGSLFLADDQDILRMTASCPDAEHNVPEPGSFQPGEGMAGKAAGKHEVVYLSDPSDFPGEADPSEPLLCVPLTDEDTLTGTMNFFGNSGQFELTDENKVFLQAIARLTMINKYLCKSFVTFLWGLILNFQSVTSSKLLIRYL